MRWQDFRAERPRDSKAQQTHMSDLRRARGSAQAYYCAKLMSTIAHIRSSWRDPIGKVLTNAAITKWEKLGFYGAERAANHILYPCVECKRTPAVFFRNRYLPTPGFYCLNCRATHRQAHETAELEEAKLRELLLSEYV